MLFRRCVVVSLLSACTSLRPEGAHKYARVIKEQLEAEAAWTSSDLGIVCHDPMTCGPKDSYGRATAGRCRDFECSGCGLGKCFNLSQAKSCCAANAECSAVYGGGSHWWTFNAPCVEEEHANYYHVFHRGAKAPEPEPPSQHALLPGCSTSKFMFENWGTVRLETDDHVAGEAVCCNHDGKASRHIRDGAPLFNQSLNHDDCTTTSGTKLETTSSPSHTFLEAVDICKSAGLRLCRNQDELDTACTSGCKINHALAWVDSSEHPQSSAPKPTQPPAEVPPQPTQPPVTVPPPVTEAPSHGNERDFPAGLMTCHAGTAAMKTDCGAAGPKNREIRNRVIDHFHTLGTDCTVESCPRGDFAGCLVRLVGHDIMDFDPALQTGGADGCIDFEDHDNNGLKGCLLEAVSEPDSTNVSLELMWQDYCTEVSVADYFVIVAEALMEATVPEAFRADFGSKLESQFRFGRETQATCSPGLLPNPGESCDAVEKNFINNLGLTWEESTALMGVHTLGRALPSNSGFDGFWVSGRHATNFSNQYYSNMLGVGWARKKTIADKWQWQRVDVKNSPEMMLNTDMCLAYATGEAPFTRAEDPSHGSCCLWRRNHTMNSAMMDGVPCDCQGTDPAKGCSSHRNCCRESMAPTCPGDSTDNSLAAVQQVRGNTESVVAVSKFAKSQQAWLDVFIPVWKKVTTNGMRNMCE